MVCQAIACTTVLCQAGNVSYNGQHGPNLAAGEAVILLHPPHP